MSDFTVVAGQALAAHRKAKQDLDAATASTSIGHFHQLAAEELRLAILLERAIDAIEDHQRQQEREKREHLKFFNFTLLIDTAIKARAGQS